MYLLTNDSIKYWDHISGSRGMCFHKENNIFNFYEIGSSWVYGEDYDNQRYYPFSIHYEPLDSTMFYFDKDSLFICNESAIPPIFDDYRIHLLSEDSLVLDYQGNKFVYLKSSDQSTSLGFDPGHINGFKEASVVTSKEEIHLLADSVYALCKEEGSLTPNECRVVITCFIDTAGVIYDNNYYEPPVVTKPCDGAENMEAYEQFFKRFLEMMKNIRCLPSRNEETNEKYKSKYSIILRLSYE